MTGQEIAQVAWNAGFRDPDLIVAVAIAYAESSGNPNAYYPETAYFADRGLKPEAFQGQGSYGLWQIFRAVHLEYANANLMDPQVNACAAYGIYLRAGRNFKPWATFTGGSYQKHLAQAQQDVASINA